jgi:hypothetical protein
MSTITNTGKAIDVADDPERLHARRGGLRRAHSSAACFARRSRRIAAVVTLPALGAGCADSPRRFRATCPT